MSEESASLAGPRASRLGVCGIGEIGLDLVYSIHQYLLGSLANNRAPSALLAEMVGDGRLGVRSPQGFYAWDARRAQEARSRRDHAVASQLSAMPASDVDRAGTG